MSKFQALAKALPLYWHARFRHARRKYESVVAAIHGASPPAAPSESAQTVMIFTSVGLFADHAVVDTLLGHALRRVGAKVIVVFCDAQLAACHVSDRYANAFALTAPARRRVQDRMCRACVSARTELVEGSRLSYAFFSEGMSFISAGQSVSGVESLEIQQLDLSDEVKSGVIRFAASSHPSVLTALPEDISVRYTAAASAARLAISGLIMKYRPSVLVAHHGIYLPQGVVQKISKTLGIAFYSWHFGYRKSTLIFSRGDTYHRELTHPLPRAFEGKLSDAQRKRILDYLKSRVTGGDDWIHFNRQPVGAREADTARPYFVAYTSVDWDAALHFPASIYASQFEFLDDLVRIFRDVPNFDLVIRVHPAEVTGFHPAARSVTDHFRGASLPSNVRVIAATDRTSSYDLAKACVAAIVFNTKLGIELPPVGIPVIVAGDCWIRGKGFSYDVEARTDLERFVRAGLDLVVTDEQRERAVQFAHYFYFRRCIETPELVSTGRKKFGVEVSAAGLAATETTPVGLSFVATKILSGEHVEA